MSFHKGQSGTNLGPICAHNVRFIACSYASRYAATNVGGMSFALISLVSGIIARSSAAPRLTIEDLSRNQAELSCSCFELE